MKPNFKPLCASSILFSAAFLSSSCVIDPQIFSLSNDSGAFSDANTDGDSDPITSCGDISIIDDMEDGDGNICPTAGRIGRWNSANDTTEGAIQEPAGGAIYAATEIPGGRELSRYAVRTYGTGFMYWATMYAIVSTKGGTLPFDASKYKGIAFFARSPLNNLLKIKVRISGTVPISEGGTCEKDCHDSYAMNGIQLVEEWTEHEILFSELKQERTQTVYFNSSEILGVEFQIPADLNDDFDLWIDDLRFF